MPGPSDRTAARAITDVQTLMCERTLPGVSLVTAIALLGAIGDVRRFKPPRQLVAYLGLDPRVRQSGNEPAKHGKIGKQRPGDVRGLLVEAAWHAARSAESGAVARATQTRARGSDDAAQQTGAGGDFESLARALKARPIRPRRAARTSTGLVERMRGAV